MSLRESGDIYYITVNDVNVRMGKSNHVILNPEEIESMYGVNLGDRSLTLQELTKMAERSSIRAFRSFVSNLNKVVESNEAPVVEEEPRVVRVTRTVVQKEDNTARLAIYAKVSSILKAVTFLFVVVIVICVIAIWKIRQDKMLQ